jgi:hypothetical protein
MVEEMPDLVTDFNRFKSHRASITRNLHVSDVRTEFDMTGEQLRKMHNECAQLLAQWGPTSQQMQTLNEVIEKTINGFEMRKGQDDPRV